ncbi:RNA 2',3'-cyclic phosphodiesterase [Zobellella maritima]|uniref:RNA 2',3'-cyclic phosphodiesterase n=1 Tax=Zobellella maritima TaxID=2059725 RepID=UPI000E304AF5|nr:RNA 2',3'-cyclic phosphodiesterase [Zobellella maritima]
MPKSTQRLFLAFPAGQLTRPLLRLQDRLALSGRRIPPEQFHLTLRFLGELDAVQQAQVEQMVDRLPLVAFRLELDKLGCFGRARVLWLGPTQIPEPLITLAGQTELGIQELGLPASRPGFHPHISLFRHTSAGGLPSISPIHYQPDRLTLYASRPTSKGPVYECERSWPLTSG